MDSIYSRAAKAGGQPAPNYDAVEDIHYGVISQHSLCPEALDDIFSKGEDLAFENLKVQIVKSIRNVCDAFEDEDRADLRAGIRDALSDHVSSRNLPSVTEEVLEYVVGREKGDAFDDGIWDVISQDISDSFESSSDYLYQEDGYVIRTSDLFDLFVIKSKFFTWAPFCSPCAPNAGHLDSATRQWESLGKGISAVRHMAATYPKTYCFGHDWFGEDGAPYPVFRVSDGVQLVRLKRPQLCPLCSGSGRDTAQRIADFRGQDLESVKAELRADTSRLVDYDDEHGTFQCYRCSGSGKIDVVEDVEAVNDRAEL